MRFLTAAALFLALGALALARGPSAAPAAGADEPGSRAEQLREELAATPHTLAELGREMVDRFLRHLPGVVSGLVLFLVFWAAARLFARLLRRVLARADSDPALAGVLVPVGRAALVLLGLLVAVEQMGFNVGSLLAGLGIAGLAIGLAAQETLGNVFAGFVLLWDRPFRSGDAVTIAGTFGHVTEIGLRSTRLRTLEHLEVILPNRQVVQEQILNHTRYPRIRLNVPFAVGHGADLDRVRAVALAVAAADALALAEPAPAVLVTALGESGIHLELRLWIEPSRPEAPTLFHYLEAIRRALDAADIEIPLPQRVVHVRGGTGASAPLPAPR